MAKEMYKNYIKRLLDIMISLVALPFLALIFIIIAPIIFFTDRGPVFYNGERVGKNGKIYKMFKFRSMRVNAPDLRNEDGTTYNGEDDPRVTKIGKFIRKTSIDETPQILNILLGDMSLIGPRPDLPDALTVYTEYERKKLSVRPGITGYSQAYHRNLIEIHERYKEDIFYCENLSFILDVKIFFKTIMTVLKHDGVYRSEKDRKITVRK